MCLGHISRREHNVCDVIPAFTVGNCRPVFNPLGDRCGVHPHPWRVRCPQVRVQCPHSRATGQPMSFPNCKPNCQVRVSQTYARLPLTSLTDHSYQEHTLLSTHLSVGHCSWRINHSQVYQRLLWQPRSLPVHIVCWCAPSHAKSAANQTNYHSYTQTPPSWKAMDGEAMQAFGSDISVQNNCGQQIWLVLLMLNARD